MNSIIAQLENEVTAAKQIPSFSPGDNVDVVHTTPANAMTKTAMTKELFRNIKVHAIDTETQRPDAGEKSAVAKTVTLLVNGGTSRRVTHERSFLSCAPRHALGPSIRDVHMLAIVLLPLLVLRLKDISEAVAEDVESHDHEEDHEPRPQRHPRCVGHEAPRRPGAAC